MTNEGHDWFQTKLACPGIDAWRKIKGIFSTVGQDLSAIDVLHT